MYLTATAWIKDEAEYLAEWIEFHLNQGFEKFYLWDNNSEDNTYEVLKPYEEVVEISKYPPEATNPKNFWVMQHTINNFKHHKWLFHHSIDEYMFCPDGTKVSTFLKEFEDYAGVAVPWRLFNSGGQEKKEPGKVTNRFVYYVDDPNKHIKTIIQPAKTRSHVGNPHVYRYLPGEYAVYADKTPHKKNGPHAGAMGNEPYLLDEIRINHYVTMSREEYDIKMNKGLLDHPDQENRRRESSESIWNSAHDPKPWKVDLSLVDPSLKEFK